METFNLITQAIEESKPTFIPNAFPFKPDVDFNVLTKIINSGNGASKIKVQPPVGLNQSDVLLNPFQYTDVQNSKEVNPIHTLIFKNLSDRYNIDRADFFFSMKRSIGVAHIDKENSLILGVYNKTIYRFENLDITISIGPGDVLLSPSGHTHFAMSYQERIILSWGLYKK